MQKEFEPGLIAARSHLPIPSQPDFCNELKGDAGYAWRNFGGLTLEAAYWKFIESPQTNQEDFMWMFPKAFEYYYPVLDRYLRSVNVSDDVHGINDGCRAWFLGCALEEQFHWTDGSRPPDYVVGEIRDLSHYVRHHLSQYSNHQSERDRIDDSWQKLDETLSLYYSVTPN